MACQGSVKLGPQEVNGGSETGGFVQATLRERCYALRQRIQPPGASPIRRNARLQAIQSTKAIAWTARNSKGRMATLLGPRFFESGERPSSVNAEVHDGKNQIDQENFFYQKADERRSEVMAGTRLF